MAKQSEQMASSWQASNLDLSNHFNEHKKHGLLSYRLCYEVCELHPTTQLDSLPCSSYTAQRQSFPLILSSTHLIAPYTRRQKVRNLDKTALIKKNKLSYWLSLGRQYTN